MISIIFDKTIFKVLTLFSTSPGSKFKRNELKAKIKANNVPLDDALARLVKLNLLKKEKKTYSINFENNIIKQILDIVSKEYKRLKELPFDVYFLLTDLISAVKLVGLEILLFGSYSKLIFNENSDIDLAILVEKNFDKRSVDETITKLEKKYGKKIETHIFKKSEFYKNKRDPLVKDILRNGVKLI